MTAIHTLKPNVSQTEAIEAFRARGIAGLLGHLRVGGLRLVAEVHVPFRLYQVHIWNGGRCQTRWLALDAVSGALDPYEFERIPDSSELVRVKTRNRLEPVVAEEQTRKLLTDKLQRLIFQTGFFRIRDLKIRSELVPLELHVPYWIGFYGADEYVRLRVLDAVRNRLEGGKARAFFETWLASNRRKGECTHRGRSKPAAAGGKDVGGAVCGSTECFGTSPPLGLSTHFCEVRPKENAGEPQEGSADDAGRQPAGREATAVCCHDQFESRFGGSPQSGRV